MTQSPPSLDSHVTRDELVALVRQAHREDLGPQGVDITSQTLVPAEQVGRAVFRARAAGRLCGAAILPTVVEIYDSAVQLDVTLAEGDQLVKDAVIAEVRGPLRSVLALERVALNFLTHLSGIATLTDAYVRAAAGTKAKICDTRKTVPGLRGLQKYAVQCGGAVNHRIGLYDAVLIKDNHIAHLSLDDLPDALKTAFQAARNAKPAPKFIEVEVDTLDQLQRVLPCGPDIVLLDNMNLDQLRQAVAIRNDLSPNVELEASGGVTLDTVPTIAATGVDRIAVGALTHSAPALDIGLDILS